MYDTERPRCYRRSSPRRRPRLVAVAAGVAVSALLLIGGVAYGGASSGPQRVTVHSGDTLWGIVAAHYGTGDMQSRIAEVEAANHLGSAAISPGRILTLPAP